MKFITYLLVTLAVMTLVVSPDPKPKPVLTPKYTPKAAPANPASQGLRPADNRLLPVDAYTPSVGKEFLTLASYSYCSYEQMKDGSCCTKQQLGDYQVIHFGKVQQDDYTFGLLRNDKTGRIVVTLTGTKKGFQLLKEAWWSNMVQMEFTNTGYNILISSYFNTIFTQVRAALRPVLEQQIKAYPKYQVIYTGHSLGAAIASIMALDGAMTGYIPRTATSPALINYASPRAGNYYFAAHCMKHIPVIFRIVRNNDTVVRIPPCSYVMKCSNSLGLENFTGKDDDFIGKSKPKDKNYWHLGGLFLYTNDMTKYANCGRQWSENHPKPECQPSYSTSQEDHTHYLGSSVSGLCKGAENRALRLYRF